MKQMVELEQEFPQAKFVNVKMTKDSYKELNLAGSHVDVFYSEVAEEPVFEPEPDDYSVDSAVVEEVAEAY